MNWTDWELDPGIVAPLLLTAVLYAVGCRRHAGLTPVRRACFWTGWLSLVFALVSPLHPLGEKLFSAHMIQHEILMLISAPLLVISRPLVTFLWALPFEWRRTVGRWSKKNAVQNTWAWLTAALTAWWIHALAIWAWHMPPLMDAALRNDLMHAAQHLSFLLSALVFWWALLYAHGRRAYGSGVLYVFTTALHTGILGALLTFAPTAWYAPYAHTTQQHGLTPLQDQQIGGLITWVPASVCYLIAGLYLFAAWMRESDLMLASRATSSSLEERNVRNNVLVAAVIASVTLTASCANRAAQADQIAQAATGGSAARGLIAISHYGCGSCHVIPGVSGAFGKVGPPLAGIGSRFYVAGVLQNTPSNLERWIENPPGVDEHTVMPNLGVSHKDAVDIAGYLYTLR